MLAIPAKRECKEDVMARTANPVPDETTKNKPWYERHPVFKDAIFYCEGCDHTYNPPPTPAICECGEDLKVAAAPKVVPTEKTVRVCVQCGTESDKMKVDLQGGKSINVCPVCGSTGGVLEVTVPLSEDETRVLTERNDERARVYEKASAISTVKDGEA
jgi:hypothetical protein